MPSSGLRNSHRSSRLLDEEDVDDAQLDQDALSTDDADPARTPLYWAWQAGDYARAVAAAAQTQATSRTSVLGPARLSANHPGRATTTPHQQHQHRRRASNPALIEGDDDSKPPATGSNALPLSPPRRYRDLLALDDDQQHRAVPTGYAEASSSQTCEHCSALASNSTRSSRQKVVADHIRPSSFLQPGMVFTGHQNFTTYTSSLAAPSSSSSSPASSLPLASAGGYLLPPLRNQRQHPRPYTAPRTPSQLIPTQSVPPYPFSAYAHQLPSWSDIQDSAIDPQIQALLSTAPAYQRPSTYSYVGRDQGNALAKGSSKQEWEVRVSITQVDYEKGHLKGVMTAVNVPTQPSLTTTAFNASSESKEAKSGVNTITTSFEGEIVDLHNHNLWTCSEGAQRTSIFRPSSHSYNEDLPFAHLRAQESSSGPAWLAGSATVDKTTDLEYWSKMEAFSDLGATAEKEICRIAREKSWTAAGGKDPTYTAPAARRSVPADYILMRWKERDFISCEAQASGLTISGFYYICLNRITGSLNGFYYDPMSTPHQRLELQASRTAVSSDANLSRSDSQPGGRWFGQYSLL